MAILDSSIINGNLTTNGNINVDGLLNLKASGNNETNIGANGIRWNSTSLPENTSPQYICVIDGFANGGRQKWSSIANLKTALGISSFKTINNESILGSGNITISGGGGGSTYPSIQEVSATTGNSFTINPGCSYDLGTRGVSTDEEITLTFNTSNDVAGEFIFNITALNHKVTLHTNLDPLTFFVEPLETGVTFDRTTGDITLHRTLAYQMSILGNFVNGLFAVLQTMNPISNVIVDKDGIVTFDEQYSATAYKIDGTSITQNSNISSLLSSTATSHVLSIESSIFPSWSGTYYMKLETGSIYNLILDGTTLTWDSAGSTYSYSITSSDGKSAISTANSINLSTNFTKGTTIYVARRYGISTSSDGSISSSIGYCYGPKSSIVYPNN